MSIRMGLLLAVALAACSGETAAPSLNAAKDGVLGQSAASGSDTSAAIGYTGTVHLTGRVLGQTQSAGAPGADSLQATPLAGAVVKLYRNVLQNGEGTSIDVGQFTTRADGSYEFSNLSAGYYLLRTNIAEGPWSSNTLSYVTANAASVTVDVRIWKR